MTSEGAAAATEANGGRRYQGASSDERAARRRARFIDAGIELFASAGIAETRVRDVCRVSGVTERYFYESFGNAGDFAVAVVDHVMASVAQQVQARAATSAAGRDRVRSAVEALVEILDADPRLGRIMYIETVGNGPELAARRHDMIEGGAGLLGVWINPPAERTTSGPSPELVPFVLAGAVIEVLVAWLERRTTVSKAQIVDSLISLYDWAVPTPARKARLGSARRSEPKITTRRDA